jgi:hypothetical protein
LKKINRRTCIDCLYCKVSVKSTADKRLCYCGMEETVKTHKEVYWFTKKVCNAFENMD